MYVVSQRMQTVSEIMSGKFKPGEAVYGVRKCPACLIAGVDIGPPDDTKELSGVVHDGWCRLAERSPPKPAIAEPCPEPKKDPAHNRQLDEAFAKYFARVESMPAAKW
jgi:hypothetical protein